METLKNILLTILFSGMIIGVWLILPLLLSIGVTAMVVFFVFGLLQYESGNNNKQQEASKH